MSENQETTVVKQNYLKLFLDFITRNKKLVLRLVFFASLILMVVSVGMIIYINYDNYKGTKEYEELSEIYHEKSTQHSDTVPKATIDKEVKLGLAELQKMNPDIVGWIKISDTNIDYPIVQSEDNDYYMRRSAEKNSLRKGSIFMDFRNDSYLRDKNTIIYGHNMKDTTMFSQLMKFKEKDYYDKHRTFTLDLLNGSHKLKVFSVYKTDTKFDYLKTDFEGSEFIKYVDTIEKMSMYKDDVVVTPIDRIVTLSTCSYEFNNARTVIHALVMD